MRLELTGHEIELLLKIVDQYYSNLREEIYKTEAYQIKGELKVEEDMVKSLLEKLRAAR
jgi:hypothetical protein